jgi:intracellular sulfur oxidation DsrE/DsrF family protein
MVDLLTIASTKQEPGSHNKGNWIQVCNGWVILLLVCLPGLAFAQSNEQINALLRQGEAPDGIVFEIVESDETALQELLPEVRVAIERIRQRFPNTDFAVVSHGSEEFALQSQYQDELVQIHQQVQSLVADDVPVHVCETHASWYGVSAEDFPDYVDVAPTGPGQIILYQELGYQLINIESPN